MLQAPASQASATQAPASRDFARPSGNGKRSNHGPRCDCSECAAPWVAAEELQPRQRPQSVAALDQVDEALMGSFPCSDPPSYNCGRA